MRKKYYILYFIELEHRHRSSPSRQHLFRMRNTSKFYVLANLRLAPALNSTELIPFDFLNTVFRFDVKFFFVFSFESEGWKKSNTNLCVCKQFASLPTEDESTHTNTHKRIPQYSDSDKLFPRLFQKLFRNLLCFM